MPNPEDELVEAVARAINPCDCVYWAFPDNIENAKRVIAKVERALLEEMRDVPVKWLSEAYGLSDFYLAYACGGGSKEGCANEMRGAWIHVLKRVAEKRNIDLSEGEG